MKIIGYDGFTYGGNEKRLNEVFNTIRWNTKFFDRILIFFQSTADILVYNSLKFFKNVEFILLPENTPDLSMQDLFNLVNQNSHNDDIKCFSNLDTIFSDTWNSIVIEDDVFLLLTNRTTEDGSINGGVDKPSWTEGLNLFNQKGVLDPTKFVNYNDPNLPSTLHGRWCVAQCGWAWKTIKPLGGKFFLGTRGAENGFLIEIRKAGYLPRSGALKYPTYHNHCSDIRTNKKLISVNVCSDGCIKSNEVL